MSLDILITEDGITKQEAGEVVVVEGAQATENRLRIALNTQLGEVENDNIGVDYFNTLQVANPNISGIRRRVRDIFLDDPAVESITAINVDRDRKNRAVTITVEAIADEGEEIRVTGGLN